jgi:hypothetical protein
MPVGADQCISDASVRVPRGRRRPSGFTRHDPFVYPAVVDERHFFTERPEQRPARLQCKHCRRTNDYSIRWMRRTKKGQAPAGADPHARALFAKVKDHLVRIDDDVTCKTCNRRFEIPSHRALVFLEELEGLPQVDEEA